MHLSESIYSNSNLNNASLFCISVSSIIGNYHSFPLPIGLGFKHIYVDFSTSNSKSSTSLMQISLLWSIVKIDLISKYSVNLKALSCTVMFSNSGRSTFNNCKGKTFVISFYRKTFSIVFSLWCPPGPVRSSVGCQCSMDALSFSFYSTANE